MPSEKAAPASPAAQTSGDGQKPAANVSQAQAIAHFIEMDRTKGEATQTVETSATTEAPAPVAQGSTETPSTPSTAEPEQTVSPEATPTAPPETPEAPEATTTEGEAKPSGEADDVLSPESQTIDQKTKEKIQRRIDKEVGKRKALEAQLEQVKNRLAEVAQAQPPAPPIMPDAKPPLPDIKDPTALVEYKKNAKETQIWAEDMLDRDDIDNGIQVGEKTYTKAEIKGFLRNARRALEDTIPAQEQYFRQQVTIAQQRAMIHQNAVARFPFIAEEENKDVQQATSFFKTHIPQIMSHPAKDWIIGAYIKGIRAAAAEAEAAKAEATKPKTAPAPKPVVPKPRAPADQTAVSTTGAPNRQSPDTEARERMRPPTGNMSAGAAAQYLANKDRLRSAG